MKSILLCCAAGMTTRSYLTSQWRCKLTLSIPIYKPTPLLSRYAGVPGT